MDASLEDFFRAAGTSSRPRYPGAAASTLSYLNGGDPRQKAIEDMYKNQAMKAQQQGDTAFGNSFLAVMGGQGDGTQLPLPQNAPLQDPNGQQPILSPMQGGNVPLMPKMPISALQPPGAPGMSPPGMGPRPPASPSAPGVPMQDYGNLPQPGPMPQQGTGQSSTPGGQPQLTWQSIASALKQKAPGLSGQAMAAAIDKFAPIMQTQSKAQWDMLKQQMGLQVKEAVLDERIRHDTAIEGGRGGASGSAGLEPNTLDRLTQMYIQIGPSALQSADRGTKTAVIRNAGKVMAENGLDPDDLVKNWSGAKGSMSEGVSIGRRGGAVKISGQEFENIAKPALELSKQIPRDGWRALGNVETFLNTQQNDPKLAKFQVMIDSLVTAYARSTGGGVASVEGKAQAIKLLSAAQSQPAFEAAVKTMQNTIRSDYRGATDALKGKDLPAPEWNDQGGAPDASGWSIKERGK